MSQQFTGFYPWLFDLRGIIYDALHLFVNPNGYRLSDNVWRADLKTRNAIDNLLAYEIRQGTSAVKIADLLVQYLRPGRAGIRTDKPYGRWGSYDARRLARTEITAAAGRATTAAAQRNPFVEAIHWALSQGREDWDCNCEQNATQDVAGLGEGNYPKDAVPTYPDHPHCMCTLSQVASSSVEAVVEDLRAWLAEDAEGQGYSAEPAMMDLTGNLWDLLALWGSKGLL